MNPPEPQFLLPAARSTVASGIDGLFMFIFWMCLILFFLIVGGVIYSLMNFRRKEGDEKKLSIPTIHSLAIELFWSLGPLLVCIGLFHVGAKQYMDSRVAPANAVTVNVRARKWAWEFEYATGKVDAKLHVPVNKPVKLVITSQDVIHSFYVPDFRVKYDAIPGRYTMVWFEATQTGENQIFCTEYCGLSHSDMLSKVVVMEPAAFDTWVNESDDKMPPLELGKKLFGDKGCGACHSIDGTPGAGPSLKGLWDKAEALADGSTAKVDEAYLRESILVPGAKVVKGFQPVMPSFQGSLKEKQVTALIEYIKTLK